MKKRKEKRAGFGKILDAWAPPDGVGQAIGCAATSFTFSSEFFEEECLSRFLQLESDATEDGPIYLIEREEKLAGLACATALVDQHHCRGSRSLRWDLLPVRIAGGGVLHAKVTLLHWERLVRLIVASANITADGYRRNQEIFGVLDFTPTEYMLLNCLDGFVEFLRQLGFVATVGSEAPPSAVTRLNAFLDRVTTVCREWSTDQVAKSRYSVGVTPVLVGPDRGSAMDQIREVWPDVRPPDEACVTSPFFDPPEAENKPASEVWKLLRRRGAATVVYNLVIDTNPGTETLSVRAPESIIKAKPKNRLEADVVLRAINERNGEADTESIVRPLHLKSLWLENEKWAAYMIGSSNFTSAGLGLGSSVNLEANLLYTVPKQTNPAGYKLIKQSRVDSDEVPKDLNLHWIPAGDEDMVTTDAAVSLPAGFKHAEYGQDDTGKHLRLGFSSSLPTGWSVSEAGIGTTLIDEDRWRAQGSPRELRVDWRDKLPPSGLEVSWTDSGGPAWWPVNIAETSVLPPPEELKELPLEVLISVLTSARPLHVVLRRWLKRTSKEEDGLDKPILDPHKRVDTSSFLLQRTRRLSWALTALRKRLERPVQTQEVLWWRLYGPVGAKAVQNAITREASSEAERQFLITELALELSRVKPYREAGGVAPAVIREELRKLISEMQADIALESSGDTPELAEYMRNAFALALQAP